MAINCGREIAVLWAENRHSIKELRYLTEGSIRLISNLLGLGCQSWAHAGSCGPPFLVHLMGLLLVGWPHLAKPPYGTLPARGHDYDSPYDDHISSKNSADLLTKRLLWLNPNPSWHRSTDKEDEPQPLLRESERDDFYYLHDSGCSGMTIHIQLFPNHPKVSFYSGE